MFKKLKKLFQKTESKYDLMPESKIVVTFNNEAVILAATSVVNNKFLVWKVDENQTLNEYKNE